VSKDDYTSVYVSRKLKRQLVEAARADSYKVGRGRGSRLAEFIATVLEEYIDLAKKDPTLYSLRQLSPELRSSIKRLSEMDGIQQKRACAILDLLLNDQESGQDAQE
jgi:hypothetical protein